MGGRAGETLLFRLGDARKGGEEVIFVLEAKEEEETPRQAEWFPGEGMTKVRRSLETGQSRISKTSLLSAPPPLSQRSLGESTQLGYGVAASPRSKWTEVPCCFHRERLVSRVFQGSRACGERKDSR